MTTRAVLFAALLSAPLAAAGQNQPFGVAEFADDQGEVNFLGLAECKGGVDDLFWTLNTGTATFTQGGKYRIWVSNKAPAVSGDLANFCPEADETTIREQVGDTFDANAANAFRQIELDAIPSALGVACDPTQSEKQAFLCVEWTNSAGVRAGFANAEVTLQFRPPPPPASVRVAASENALRVEWTPGTIGSGQSEAFEYEAVATGDVTRRSGLVRGTGTRIEGLTNNTTYQVTVTAYSQGSNPSAASPPVDGMPVRIDDFWEHYKGVGGPDSGGCASGPAGIGALAGLALAAAVRRRRA
jgi:MYXO-CTERM domain-containing protein